jgi:hypothetical protein
MRSTADIIGFLSFHTACSHASQTAYSLLLLRYLSYKERFFFAKFIHESKITAWREGIVLESEDGGRIVLTLVPEGPKRPFHSVEIVAIGMAQRLFQVMRISFCFSFLLSFLTFFI